MPGPKHVDRLVAGGYSVVPDDPEQSLEDAGLGAVADEVLRLRADVSDLADAVARPGGPTAADRARAAEIAGRRPTPRGPGGG